MKLRAKAYLRIAAEDWRKKYNSVWPSREGLHLVELHFKYGFVDKTGKELIPPKYDEVWGSREGLHRVELKGKWGLVDKTGKELIPPKYTWIEDFIKGLAIVQLNFRKWGFIDKTGNEVIPLKYDYVEGWFDGFYKVKLDDKWGYVNEQGKEVISPKYADIWSFHDGLAIVNVGGEYVESVESEEDEDLDCDSYTLEGGQWGFVNKQGEEVIPPKYDWVDYFHNGIAKVKLGDKMGWVTLEGKELLITKDNYIQIKNLIELEKITEKELINWVKERAV